MTLQEKIEMLKSLAYTYECTLDALQPKARASSQYNQIVEALKAGAAALQATTEPPKMTRDRAIRLLDTGTKMPDFPHTADEVDEACKIAVSAMKKQEPVKLRYGGAAWRCPACAMAARPGDRYCGYCGQRYEMPYMED